MGQQPRVLCIYKKSAYRIYVRERKHARVAALLRMGHDAVNGLQRAHRAHERSLREARRILRKLGARAVFRHRSSQTESGPFDLVVTLGGDGTLLWASHAIGSDCPVLAINSAPEDSVGFLCAATSHELADALRDALQGKLPTTELARMRVDVDGELCTKRVLNDALFCHLSPAATSRYELRFRGRSEEHKSSGVWIATAAGSTAAIHSAGGKVQALSSQRLQFVVRELYPFGATGCRLRKGLVAADEKLEIQSHMRTGRLYIDGPHRFRAVEIGSRLSFRRSDEPLSVLGFYRRKLPRS